MTPKKPKIVDFRHDTRNTGIPRNYFIHDGVVVNASSSRKEISKTIHPRPGSELEVKLINAPERASKLIFGDQIDRKMTAQISQDKTFRKFITEGPRITDGSFQESSQDKVISKSRKLILPSYNRDLMIKNLQR